MSIKMTQNQYTILYGPTVGESIRLGDTNIFAQIEKDYAVYGDVANFGGGISISVGMAQNHRVTRDVVIVAYVV
ncbi:urease subunit alpha, partial [Staphylococcus aureus]|nr:urease subunit alpha [Staphylococcus aureus]